MLYLLTVSGLCVLNRCCAFQEFLGWDLLSDEVGHDECGIAYAKVAGHDTVSSSTLWTCR